MKKESYELFKNIKIEQILLSLKTELATRNESPFWGDKVVPFSEAILSILVELKKQDLLFNPEGVFQAELTPELFLKWSDFVSLKYLAFTIQKSNEQKELLRTKLDAEVCKKYTTIDLTKLGDYLAKYNVNLEDENLDFPISHYNLHQGVSNVITSLL